MHAMSINKDSQQWAGAAENKDAPRDWAWAGSATLLDQQQSGLVQYVPAALGSIAVGKPISRRQPSRVE